MKYFQKTLLIVMAIFVVCLSITTTTSTPSNFTIAEEQSDSGDGETMFG